MSGALSNTTTVLGALYWVFQNNALLGRVLNAYPLSKAALSKGTNYCMSFQDPLNSSVSVGLSSERIIQIFEAPNSVTPVNSAEAAFISIAKYNNFFYGTVLSLLWAQNQLSKGNSYCKTYEVPVQSFPDVSGSRQITLTTQQIIILGNSAIKGQPLPENF